MIPTVKRSAALLAATAIIAACSTGSADATDQPDVAPDPFPTRPVLTLVGECYGLCAGWIHGSLPSITVYPEGTVLRAGFEVEGLTITRGQVEMTRVDELVALARQAGLTGGGVQAILPLPDGIGVADGGGSVFSYRDGDTITTRDVPHLYDFDGWNRSGERGLFLELQMALYALEASEPFDWSGEALLVQTSPAIEPDPAPWTGPDFRNGTRETILGGCAIVAPLGPLTVEASWIRDYDVHGERWTISRRPLLPHEFSCADLELYSKLRPAAR